MKCDACGSEGDIRLAGELLGPAIHRACRNCVGGGIGWFYLRRPGDFDDDITGLPEKGIPASGLPEMGKSKDEIARLERSREWLKNNARDKPGHG